MVQFVHSFLLFFSLFMFLCVYVYVYGPSWSDSNKMENGMEYQKKVSFVCHYWSIFTSCFLCRLSSKFITVIVGNPTTFGRATELPCKILGILLLEVVRFLVFFASPHNVAPFRTRLNRGQAIEASLQKI